MSGGRDRVLEHHGLRLAFDHSLAGIIHLVVFDIGWSGILADLAQILFSPFQPTLHVYVLVLKSVGKFVRHDRLLLLHGHPIKQVHGFGLGIVVAGDFFLQKRNQKRFEIEVARKQSEFLQNQFGATEALGVFVVEVFGQVRLDLVAARKLAFDVVFDRQSSLLTVELKDLVNGVKQLFGLARSNFDVTLPRLLRLVRRGDRLDGLLRRGGLLRLRSLILCLPDGNRLPKGQNQHDPQKRP